MTAHDPPYPPPPPRSPCGGFPTRLLALWLLAVSLALAPAATPPAEPVLVIVSDASVARYREVRDAFTQALGAHAWKEVDLAQAGEPGVRRALAASSGVLYSIGSPAYEMARKLAPKRPIIISTALHWARLQPGTQTARVIANELPAGAQLTLFRHLFPKLRRVGVVYDPALHQQWFTQAVAAGREAGIEVLGRAVRRPVQVGSALAQLTPQVDALWLLPDPMVMADEAAARRYFTHAEAARKPVFAYSPAFTELGATLVLAPDPATTGRQAAAALLDFAGTPAVSAPGGSEVTLSLPRVEQYGLDLNRAALGSVNHLLR